MKYNFNLDPWQEEVLKTNGNLCLRSGRQVGKSTIIGLKAAKYALENKEKLIMVISKTERQAELLFSKILFNLTQMGKAEIKKGKERPTKHKINLKNGSVIHCLPTGDTGFGIMGYTIDLLIADEAAWIPPEVWNSIIPSMAITRGNIWVLSTPYLKEGYFYECFTDPTFTSFHTTSEECPRRDDAFLAHKKETLSKAQYSQMYLGEFIDEFKKFFPDDLIEKCCVGLEEEPNKKNKNYLGCDVGRIEDPFTFEIVKEHGKNLKHVYHRSVIDKSLTENSREIIRLNKLWDFKAEYIDSGGMGIGVCDILREDSENKRKVVEINNSSRPYDKEEHRKKILKEDLYNNLKTLMEQGKIILLNNESVKDSLRSITADFNDRGRLIITGNDTHIVEGIIRAAWCWKDKHLNIFVRTF